MAITKDYEIDRVEIDPATANASIRMRLVIVEDGVVISERNHRVSILATAPLGTVAAMVNAALTAEGYPTLAAADTASVGATLNAARANKGKPALPRAVG